MKRFKTTGLCNPNKHYMVNINDKLDEIKKLISNEEYFIINRPRQYGKTTALSLLKNELRNEYLVISISFEGIGDNAFNSEKNFIDKFLSLIGRKVKLYSKETYEKFLALNNNINDFIALSDFISDFIMELDKEVILIIDEVDKSSDNQLFLSFLGMLRSKYLEREAGDGVTFKSVILAGIYDIRNLKLKLKPNEERKYNSPWNIAVPFNIDMSLSKDGIEEMLKEYFADKNIVFNAAKASEFIYFYTDGYPFLVSRLCQIIDEYLDSIWTEENMIKSVKILLSESNTLFDDLIKNVENNEELREYVSELIINGRHRSFNIDNPIINLGFILGYFKNDEGKVKISNRIFEERLYISFQNIHLSEYIDINTNNNENLLNLTFKNNK